MFSEVALCPAKINLTLSVGNKLVINNLHQLESVFLKFGLFDQIRIRGMWDIGKDSNFLKINCYFSNKLVSHFEAENRNLDEVREEISNKEGIIHKTFFEFQSFLNCSFELDLYKNIPLEAGLGGGSSNAAGVIRILKKYLPRIPSEKIDKIAENLGFDVQPLLMPAPCYSKYDGALLTKEINVSKKLEPMLRDLFVFIAKPKEGSSTKQAYQKLNRQYNTNNSALIDKTNQELESIMLSLVDTNKSEASLINNDFQHIIFNDLPCLGEFIEKNLRISNPLCYGLSGSGSSLFFLYPNYKSAKLAYISNRESIDKGWFLSISKILL